MTSPSIATRMIDYFERQIALFEELESRLTAMPNPEDEDGWQTLAENEVADKARITQLEGEFALLSAEWNATEDVPREQYDAVHALADRAQVLADQLEARYEEAAKAAQAAADSTATGLRQAHDGKQMLEGYRPGVPDARGSRMDSQA